MPISCGVKPTLNLKMANGMPQNTDVDLASQTEIVPGLVTTIIPVYNRADLLCEAVASVIDQDYRPIEIVIIDDGSTDDTPKRARTLSSRYLGVVYFFRQENCGAGVARQAGLQRARGEFIQYLDSDDLLLPRKFSTQVAGLRANPECGVSYGWTRFRFSDGSVADGPWKGSGTKVEAMFPSFLKSRWWDTPTPLYRSTVCRAAGPWTDLRAEEDWEYDCRVAALDTKLHYCPQYVVELRSYRGTAYAQDAQRSAVGLAHRAIAHQLCYGHAIRAGIDIDTPEMAHFSRALFHLSRECGAAGLRAESNHLFMLAKQAAGAERCRSLDFRAYEWISRMFGWKFAGNLARVADRLRKSSSQETLHRR
jgi:glycosyltransferase involved in cell wall biosynthesis